MWIKILKRNLVNELTRLDRLCVESIRLKRFSYVCSIYRALRFLSWHYNLLNNEITNEITWLDFCFSTRLQRIALLFYWNSHVTKGFLQNFFNATWGTRVGTIIFWSRYRGVFKRTGPRSITEFPKLVTNQTVWLRRCQASLGVRFQPFGKK